MRFGFLLALFLALPAFAHPPVSVVFDSRGNAYYSDLEQVWQVAPDGTKRVAVPQVHTHELYMDAQDNLFGEHTWYSGERTNTWGHYVWRRDASGRVTKVIPNTEGFLTNYSFARDRAGNMYFADRDHHTIVKRTPAGRNEIIVRGRFRDMRWMTVTPEGTVYYVDAGDVLRFTPDKRLTRLARLGGSRHDVQGIWFDRAGNVYVAHSFGRQVKRVTPAGVVSTVDTSIPPWAPSGGGIDRGGRLWVLEYTPTNTVRVRRGSKITP